MSENILNTADSLTSGDRNKIYGHFLDDYQCVAQIWSALLTRVLGMPITLTPEVCCLMMACGVKGSRLAGHIDHHDSLVDACGYLRGIQLIAEERERRECP